MNIIISKFQPSSSFAYKKDTLQILNLPYPGPHPETLPREGHLQFEHPHHVWQAHTIRFRKEALGRDLSAGAGLRDSGTPVRDCLRRIESDSVMEVYVGFSKMGYPQVLDHFSIERCWNPWVLGIPHFKRPAYCHCGQMAPAYAPRHR